MAVPGTRVAGGALAAGGYAPVEGQATAPVATAEIYLEGTGEWVGAGSLATARAGHAAVPLADGRVMVLGGEDASFQPLASTEIYDQVAGSWSPGPDLPAAMGDPFALALPDGRVLAITYGAFALYDPASSVWSALIWPLYYFAPALAALPGGCVLVVGSGGDAPVVYDPASGTWRVAGGMISTWRRLTATSLVGGPALVAGDGEGVYDPAADVFTPAPAPAPGRTGHVAAALTDGRVLLIGGESPFDGTADVFLGRY